MTYCDIHKSNIIFLCPLYIWEQVPVLASIHLDVLFDPDTNNIDALPFHINLVTEPNRRSILYQRT